MPVRICIIICKYIYIVRRITRSLIGPKPIVPRSRRQRVTTTVILLYNTRFSLRALYTDKTAGLFPSNLCSQFRFIFHFSFHRLLYIHQYLYLRCEMKPILRCRG